MGNCQHYDVCGFQALGGKDKCILHTDDPNKDVSEFEGAFQLKLRHSDLDFRWVVFPLGFELMGSPIGADFESIVSGNAVDFTGATFEGNVSFAYLTFGSETEFEKTTFQGIANFQSSTFEKKVNLLDSTFEKRVDFRGATFEGGALFNRAIFKGRAGFNRATFEDVSKCESNEFEPPVSFYKATFEDNSYFGATEFYSEVVFWASNFKGEAFFQNTVFGDGAEFAGAIFEAGAHFTGETERDPIFSDTYVRLEYVTYSADASIEFRQADLRRCTFKGTNLRHIEFTGARWCGDVSRGIPEDEWFKRVGVYDEIVELDEGETRPWTEIEQLYRQLKKNYEDRGDFPRAGDFHIGEKETRRRNPNTSWGVYMLLSIYRALSKYGERALPAFAWLVVVVAGCGIGYSNLGVVVGDSGEALSGVQALLFSFEATFFPFSPLELEDPTARALNLLQRLLSPLLLALLGLALRQRVKR